MIGKNNLNILAEGVLCCLFIIKWFNWFMGAAWIILGLIKWCVNISAGVDGGPRSRALRTLDPPLSPPSKVNLKHLLQPLRSHTRIFRTIGQLFKYPSFPPKMWIVQGKGGTPQLFSVWNPNIFVKVARTERRKQERETSWAEQSHSRDFLLDFL